jgi:hypothetical protein
LNRRIAVGHPRTAQKRASFSPEQKTDKLLGKETGTPTLKKVHHSAKHINALVRM